MINKNKNLKQSKTTGKNLKPANVKAKKTKKTTAKNSAINTIKEFIIENKAFILTILIVVILDKFTKSLVKYTYTHEIKVIGDFFKITLIENQGIAFGLFSEWSHPIKTILLLILSLGALIFIGNIYYKSEKIFLLQISFGLIFGGAFGNIYDRLIYKKVVDFINFGINNYRWPFFNIADSAITIGVIIIMAITLFTKEKK